jgi:hypothetical protein
MSRVSFELQKQLKPVLRAGDIERCERVIAERLAAMPRSPFHIALDLRITNSPSDIARHFDRFFNREAQRFTLAAGYTEMNGFDINTDRWYFDMFAYDNYGGHDDYGWLADWNSESFNQMTITGLEPLQEVYDSPAFSERSFDDQCSIAGLLVVVKFQDLIRRAAPLMQQLQFPLLSTAHDYDFIYETGAKKV